jgi:hypothetical protein
MCIWQGILSLIGLFGCFSGSLMGGDTRAYVGVEWALVVPKKVHEFAFLVGDWQSFAAYWELA